MLGYFSIGIIYGLYRNNGKENENYYTVVGCKLGRYGGYIRITEKKTETTII